MTKMYRPQDIEPKWQKRWQEEKAFEASNESTKQKFYCLDMFPYPSGAGLHVGHSEGYTATDIISRYKRMKGFNVIHPMGWDAFGLPAENYAIKQKIHPQITTEKAIETFKDQLSRSGLGYDWNRELNTSSPDYYKWTQWLFLAFYRNGLAYRKKAPVNWCPSCQTVLANEQVIKSNDKNVCERCDSEVVQKDLEQWFFKITDYADKLSEDLDKVDWPNSVKVAQRNWIGKQEGLNLTWKVEGLDITLKTFTKYPETIFGATFVVIAPEHELVSVLTTAENQKEVEKYVEETKKKTEIQRTADEKKKTGVFTGSYVINPVNNKKIPVWVADYVLPGYGTGAVFGVPGHDERDSGFAKKYDLDFIKVIEPKDGDDKEIIKEGTIINSEFLNGLDAQTEGKAKIIEVAIAKGFGEKVVFYHLRDWLLSRQRYWGAPIPVIYCPHCAHFEEEGECCGEDCGCDHEHEKEEKCGCGSESCGCGNDSCGCGDSCSCDDEVETFDTTEIDGVKYAIIPVLEEDLPVKLPFDVDFKPTGQSPLVDSKEFHNVKCPVCGATKGVKRESDTMDTFVDSSWYFLRYADAKNGKEFVSEKALKQVLPVDFYLGGDHVTTHLIFARFFTKVLFDLGYVDFDEPFLKFKFIGHILGEDNKKMSKRLGNVINPLEVVDAYGADTLRTYVMFMGPLDMAKSWNTKSVEGVKRFYNRIWDLSVNCIEKDIKTSSSDADRLINGLIRKVEDDIESLKFNTAIAAMMEFVNFWSDHKNEVGRDVLSTFTVLVSPFAPHIAEEIWEMLGNKDSITKTAWPTYDPSKLIEDYVTIVVQVNGKIKDRIQVNREIVGDKSAVIEQVGSAEKMREILKSLKVKNIIYVEGKLINFVS